MVFRNTHSRPDPFQETVMIKIVDQDGALLGVAVVPEPWLAVLRLPGAANIPLRPRAASSPSFPTCELHGITLEEFEGMYGVFFSPSLRYVKRLVSAFPF